MEMLLFLAQRSQQAPSASFAAGALIGLVIGVAFMVLMLAGGIWAIIRWPNEGPSRVLLSFPMLLLPFNGAIIFGFFSIIDAAPPDGTIFVVPVGWVIWFILFFYMQGEIRAVDRQADADIVYEQAKYYDQQMAASGHAQPGRRRLPGKPRLPGATAPQSDDEVLDEVPDELPDEPPKPKKPKVTRETPVFARCKACMGRWKTTAGEAKDAQECPKCGASPPELRLQVIE